MQTPTGIDASADAAHLSTAFLNGVVRVACRRLAVRPQHPQVPLDIDLWAPRASRVLSANIASGRLRAAQRFQPAALTGDALLLGYTEQVLVELMAEWDRIDALRRGDTAAWQPVIDRLERLAYHLLGPHQREDWAAWEARELAARTCADLWAWLQAHPYPFDVPFDRWSAAALHNRIRGAARSRSRRERRVALSLDQPLSDGAASQTHGDTLVDRRLSQWLDRAADREAIMQALERLDRRHALVLRLWYLEQWTAPAIAEALHCRVGNVYLLRFRALRKLKEILVREEDWSLRFL